MLGYIHPGYTLREACWAIYTLWYTHREACWAMYPPCGTHIGRHAGLCTHPGYTTLGGKRDNEARSNLQLREKRGITRRVLTSILRKNRWITRRREPAFFPPVSLLGLLPYVPVSEINVSYEAPTGARTGGTGQHCDHPFHCWTTLFGTLIPSVSHLLATLRKVAFLHV